MLRICHMTHHDTSINSASSPIRKCVGCCITLARLKISGEPGKGVFHVLPILVVA